MAESNRVVRLLPLCILSAALWSFPAQASEDRVSELEALVDPTLQVDTGTALARRQAADADLLGATATLERVLFGHSEADSARLFYASVLCRLDDGDGAKTEVELLSGRPVADVDWTEVSAACPPMTRPSAPASEAPAATGTGL